MQSQIAELQAKVERLNKAGEKAFHAFEKLNTERGLNPNEISVVQDLRKALEESNEDALRVIKADLTHELAVIVKDEFPHHVGVYDWMIGRSIVMKNNHKWAQE